MQVRFYVFEDTTSPPILLSYAASERLGIIEFKVPNEAILTAAIDTISTKRVTFSTPLQTSKTRHLGRPSNAPLKSAIKNKPFQDHLPQTTENKPFQDQLQQQSSQHHKTIKTMLSKTNQHRTTQPTVIPLKIIHYKTIHRSPLETIHFKTILQQQMLKTFFHQKSFPYILWHSWQHARQVLNKNRYNSSTSATC